MFPRIILYQHADGYHVASYVHAGVMFRYCIIPVGMEPKEYVEDTRYRWYDSYTLPSYLRGQMTKITEWELKPAQEAGASK